MIVCYMITYFGTTFETFTEIESLQGPTTLYGRLLGIFVVLVLWNSGMKNPDTSTGCTRTRSWFPVHYMLNID
jgi:hypothetical protein